MVDTSGSDPPIGDSPDSDHLDTESRNVDFSDWEFTQAEADPLSAPPGEKDVPGIVPATQWGRQVKAGHTLSRIGPARDVFIHHEGDAGGKGRDTPVVETMKRLERAAFSAGHNAIDYSFVASDAFKAEGRGWLIQGSHTLNHNSNAHAICAPGNYTLYEPKPTLIANIAGVIVDGVRRGAILQPFTVRPHSDVFGTACPGSVKAAIPAIVAQANSLLAGIPLTAPQARGRRLTWETMCRRSSNSRSDRARTHATRRSRRSRSSNAAAWCSLNGSSMMNDQKDGDRRVLDIAAPSDLVGWIPAAPGAEGLPNGGPLGGMIAITADGQAFPLAWS